MSLSNNLTFNLTRTVNSSRQSLLVDRTNFTKILSWTIIGLIFCIIGCIINILVLYVTWPRRGDKSGVNLLIFHYVMANLLYCVIHYPLRCIMVLARLFGHIPVVDICSFFQTFNNANWMVVFWSDALLAVNRVIALYLPTKYKALSTTRRNLSQIVVLWLGSIALTLPYNFGYGAVVLLSTGHCAMRGNEFYGQFYLGVKTASSVVGGVASALILIKCIMMAGTSAAFGGLRGADQAASRTIRHRIRLALMLVLTFVFTAVTSSASSVIIHFYPDIFERDQTANLWLQLTSIIQYGFSAVIILLSNKKYTDRLRKWRTDVTLFGNIVSHGQTSTRTGTEVVRIDALNAAARYSGGNVSSSQRTEHQASRPI